MAKKRLKNNNLLLGILAITGGVIILLWPGILKWVIAIFLIIWGALAIAGNR